MWPRGSSRRPSGDRSLVAERTADRPAASASETAVRSRSRGSRCRCAAYLLDPASVGRHARRAGQGVAGLRAPWSGATRSSRSFEPSFDRCESERRPHLVTIYGERRRGQEPSRRVSSSNGRSSGPSRPSSCGAVACRTATASRIGRSRRSSRSSWGILDSDDAVDRAGQRCDRWATHRRALCSTPAETDRMIVWPGGRRSGIGSLAELSTSAAPDRNARGVAHALHDWHPRGRCSPSWRTSTGCDSALLDLLEELAERCARGHWCSIRPSRPDLTAHRPGWGGGRPQRISNCSGSAVDRRCGPARRHSCSKSTTWPDVVRAKILERAEGNPFFLEEILRQLIDEKRSCATTNAGGPRPNRRRPDSRFGSVCARGADRPPAPSEQTGAPARRGRWTRVLDRFAR